MSSRQQALRERYRGRAQERIRKLLNGLAALEEGQRTEASLRDLGRELHTLKGDSSVIGLVAVSEIAHLAEEVLLRLRPEDDLTPAVAMLRGALSAVDTAIRADVAPESDAQQSLVTVRDMLQEAVPELQDSASAPARLQTGAAPDEAAAALKRASAPPQLDDEDGAPTHKTNAGQTVRVPRGAPATPGHQRWLQIRAEHIDALCAQLMDFVGHFRVLTTQLRELTAQPVHESESTEQLARRSSLNEGADRCSTKLDELASAAWSLLLVPVGPTLEDELAPYIRELAQRQGKKVKVVVKSEGAELERGILEDLREALLHLSRNAVDHGIETPNERGGKTAEGTIELVARAAAPNVILSIADDGRGVDLPSVRAAAVERLRMSPEAAQSLPEHEVYHLLFAPGFSTRTTVDDVSGRGIGLDVVRERVDALGGRVTVTSTMGHGTRFDLVVPATIGKERALVTACGGSLYALPNAQTVEVIALQDYPVETTDGRELIRFRGEPIPLRNLANVLRESSKSSSGRAVVVQGNHHRWAFAVPELVGEFDLIRRPVDALVSRFGHIAASATLDDGRLVLVLGVNGLIRLAELGAMARPAQIARARARRLILVVDDSPTVGDVVSEILTDAGFDVQRASSGQEALAAIENNLPDLVLSDVEMPIMGGFELLERIRQRWPHLPVIMLTTRGGTEDRRRASVLGANAYLVKSAFEENLLVDSIRRFLPQGA